MSQERPFVEIPTPPARGGNGDGRERLLVGIPTPPARNGDGDGRRWGENSPRIDRVALARFGMILIIVVEAMTFGGLISAFLSIKVSLPIWPPLDQPRYPVEATAINTAILLASGLTLFLFRRLYRKEDSTSAKLTLLLVATALLGVLFVGLQGVEWIRLIDFGLTVTSSSYGSIFYLLIGFHGLHVLCGVLCLGVVTWMAVARKFPRRMASLEAVGIFWYFVVLVWPVLYGVVYF